MLYFRKDIAGLCSHLYLLIIALDLNQETNNYTVNIKMDNYHCSWSDLFVIEDKNEQTRVDIHHLFKNKLIAFKNKYYYLLFDDNELRRLHDTFINLITIQPFIMERLLVCLSKYPFEESTCLYYRGTDKFTEFERNSYEDYLDHIPETGPIYVQSDEQGFIDFIKERYAIRAFSVEGFKHVNNGHPLHFNEATVEDAIEIIIIFHLIAKCPKIITNVSNVTRMALICRGHKEGFTLLKTQRK